MDISPFRFCLIAFVASVGTLVLAGTEEGEAVSFSRAQIEFFEKEIRPVLVENCLDCHTGGEAKVGLELNHRAGWLRGTDYHKVVDLVDPRKSRVLQAVRHTGKVEAMPKKGDRLPESAIAALEKWIAMKLPWPEEQAVPGRSDPRQHWSFQPVQAAELPEQAGHPIDYFVGKKLAEKGISPAPQADRATLYRRLKYSLTGLPPSFDEIQAYVGDSGDAEQAWQKQVDALLESPHYGERWARHWMDVARYSDTKGYEAANRERKFIYSHTYRDWLIRVLNEDLSFDQFVLYQLAAEQLVDWNGPERHHLAAMGFISLSKNGKQELMLDDRVDTTFRGMMGLTVSCARCHDHKFDPVSTAEYYSLYGIFRNSMESAQPQIVETPDTPEYKAYLKELADIRQKRLDFLKPKFAKILKENPKLKPDNEAALLAKLSREDRREERKLQDNVKKFIAKKEMEPDKALVVKDRKSPYKQNVYIRGNPSRRGDVVQPRFLQLASPVEPAAFQEGSGRVEMAKAIASADNPLTARVIVNRVWMWHFGEGIVRTVSDFGTQGEPPTHPELLDWLAQWFVDNDWSLKKLHRLILTSQTWRQSADNPGQEKWKLIDPENRLLWKSFRHRLDFEQIRDSIIEVTGGLDRRLYGRSEEILEPPFNTRRTVYAFIDRQNLPSVFRHFDFSNPQESTGQRPNTTIPMQALFTMNSEFVMDRASKLAKQYAGSDDYVGHLHRAVFARDPSEHDRILADSFLNSYTHKSEAPRQNLSGWSYGWGGVDRQSGKVDFHLYQYWDEKKQDWRVEKEYPIKDSPLRYAHVSRSGHHPGLGAEHSTLIRWHAPAKMKIDISGEVERPAVGKGRTGLVFHVVSSSQGILHTGKLLLNQERVDISLSGVEVMPDEMITFVFDCDTDTSHDSFHFDPSIVNSGDPGQRWTFSVDFDGPQQPLTARQAYAQALLNTNRFLFIQ